MLNSGVRHKQRAAGSILLLRINRGRLLISAQRPQSDPPPEEQGRQKLNCE